MLHNTNNDDVAATTTAMTTSTSSSTAPPLWRIAAPGSNREPRLSNERNRRRGVVVGDDIINTTETMTTRPTTTNAIMVRSEDGSSFCLENEEDEQQQTLQDILCRRRRTATATTRSEAAANNNDNNRDDDDDVRNTTESRRQRGNNNNNNKNNENGGDADGPHDPSGERANNNKNSLDNNPALYKAAHNPSGGVHAGMIAEAPEEEPQVPPQDPSTITMEHVLQVFPAAFYSSFDSVNSTNNNTSLLHRGATASSGRGSIISRMHHHDGAPPAKALPAPPAINTNGGMPTGQPQEPQWTTGEDEENPHKNTENHGPPPPIVLSLNKKKRQRTIWAVALAFIAVELVGAAIVIAVIVTASSSTSKGTGASNSTVAPPTVAPTTMTLPTVTPSAVTLPPSEQPVGTFVVNLEPEFKLTASDGDSFDYFGISVATDGETIVVGAYLDGTVNGSATGSVYAYTLSGTVWTEQAKLTSSDGTTYDYFGNSVAVDGDTIVIGAYQDDTESGIESGSTYVYTRSNETVWKEQAKLTASDGAATDRFGTSVAINRDTIVIGASEDDTENGTNSGSAYVYIRFGSVWIEHTKLTASDGAADAHFGYSVAIDGKTLVIGAIEWDNDSGGSTYVYTLSNNVWTEQAKLSASDGDAGDQFGRAVAIDGDIVVIGAPGYNNIIDSGGSAYVFILSGSAWTEQAKLTASDGAATDRFGSSVSIDGDTIVIGASESLKINDSGGSAYLYTRFGSVWTEQAKLTASDGAAEDEFGNSVAIDGDTLVIGAVTDDTGNGENSGSVYIYY